MASPSEPPTPGPVKRVFLVILNLCGAGLCAYAASTAESATLDLEPVRIGFLVVAAMCGLIGAPLGATAHPGMRSLSRALAAVGVALGGATIGGMMLIEHGL